MSDPEHTPWERRPGPVDVPPATYAAWLERWGALDIAEATAMLERVAALLPGWERPLCPARRTLAELMRALRAWVHGVRHTRAPAPPCAATAHWHDAFWNEIWLPPRPCAPAGRPLAHAYAKQLVLHAAGGAAVLYVPLFRPSARPRDEVDAVCAVQQLCGTAEFCAACGALDMREEALLRLLKSEIMHCFRMAGGFQRPRENVSVYGYMRKTRKPPVSHPVPVRYYTLSMDMYH